ncbi:hypothetical protein EI77_03088 [Prosthecobacter fusiformis]|uniref:F5/8 type C domain-containing protein n=1 Tax=Prosthecobacter fusiformis TaxID=48464 RepID=A0A4R7RUL1_9BACT|nr:hypothetical protein [Prosthecobacter fusiformis]TDU69434.1 hypothetical protein EI77_03088 [Prosthecobacter fusiformis]
MRHKYLFTLVALASLPLPTQAKWSKLPSVDEKPVSIATVFSGTTVYDSKGFNPANALLMGDPVKPVNLASGKSEAILKFAKQSVIKNVSFVNDGIEGKVALSTSTDGSAWSPVDNKVFSPSDRLIKLDGGTAQGRYLRMQFDLVRGGVIRSFQAIGSTSDANYTVTQSPDGTGMPVNFAAGMGGGRLLYISPELFGSRNDAVKSNLLEFPESDEKYRTAVYDLGQVRTLNEFGSVHSPRPVRFSVYAFDNLPEKEDWRGRLAFDPAVFDSSEPVAKAEDTSGAGFVKAKPGKTVKSRYIALRWEPDFNPPAFNAYSVTITGAANVSFSGGGVSVDSSTVDGNTVFTVNADGNTNLTITVGPNGEVNVAGSDAGPGANGPSVDVNNSSNNGEGGQPPTMGVTVGAPSASGAGLGGPSGNNNSGTTDDEDDDDSPTPPNAPN